jgi:hypothetical protein
VKEITIRNLKGKVLDQDQGKYHHSLKKWDGNEYFQHK